MTYQSNGRPPRWSNERGPVAVRSGAGVFDVSHMGQIETHGPGAEAFLQRLLSNDVSKVDVGGAQYALLCREDGGVLDDLFTYRLAEDRWLTVTNAANHATDLAWFRRHVERLDAVTIVDRAGDYAMLAVQGPLARGIVRLEVNFHLYGNDLSEERGPIAGGLGWACKEDTGFIGSEAVRAEREAGPGEWLVALVMDSGIARQGNVVTGGGVVTSGTMSPSPCRDSRRSTRPTRRSSTTTRRRE